VSACTAGLLLGIVAAGGFGLLAGAGGTLWWVTRHKPLGGNQSPEEDSHKW